MEDRFSVRPDREHGNPLKPSIYLKMSPLFCTCPVRLKRGIRTVRAKNLKKYPKNAHSPIIDDRFSDRPDRDKGNTAHRSNPFEPAVMQTKTWPMRSSPDFSEFPPNLWVVFSIQVGSFEVVLPMKEVNQITPLLWKKEEKLRVLITNPFIS